MLDCYPLILNFVTADKIHLTQNRLKMRFDSLTFFIRYAVHVVHVFVFTNKALHDQGIAKTQDFFSVKQRKQNNRLSYLFQTKKCFF